MKILRIIYDWPNPWHGLAAHPYEITLSQSKKRDEVTVLCGSWPNSGGPVTIYGVEILPIPREPFPGGIFFTSSILLFFKYLVWRRKNEIDIIHSHGHFGIWIYLYRFILQKFFPWAKELKTPLVVHFHNIPQARMESMEKTGVEITNKTKYISTPLESLSALWAAKTASANIFVSQKNFDEALKFLHPNPERCFLVETGVNTDLFSPIQKEEIEKSRRDTGFDYYDKVILNHGVMNERKNIDKLILSLKYLPEAYRLLLVGPADSEYEEKLWKIIDNEKLLKRVIWTGYTPYPLTPIAYQVSDVFVLPSSYEGLPKAVMQGLSCGIPCLVSGFELSEEIRGLEYLQNTDPESIAKRIIDIVENPPVVDVEKIKKQYSWDIRVKKIDEIYEFSKKYYLV